MNGVDLSQKDGEDPIEEKAKVEMRWVDMARVEIGAETKGLELTYNDEDRLPERR